MMKQKKQRAIQRRKANIFLRRMWCVGSKLKFSPIPDRNQWIDAYISHIVSEHTIRIEMIMFGQIFQKEVLRDHTTIKPLPKDVDDYLKYGASHFLSF